VRYFICTEPCLRALVTGESRSKEKWENDRVRWRESIEQ
jgi:hypothetical protein